MFSAGSDENRHGGIDIFCDNLHAYLGKPTALDRHRLERGY
jgi:hypothetical protein